LLLLGVLALAACNNGGDVSPGVSAGPEGTGSTSGGSGSTSGGSTFDTLDTDGGSGGTAGLMPQIDCADPPLAAVGAAYDHELALVDDLGVSWTWSATGLPPGLAMGPLGGDISGSPEEEGDFEVQVTVAHADDTGTTSCTISVGAALSVDLEALGAPCITEDDDVNDFVVGGDGSPLTCSTPGGPGEGRIPDGIGVGEDSCAIEGTTDDAYGTWVWITQLRQSGLRVPVPYCYTIEDQPPGAYTITGSHSGGTDNHLEPAVVTFGPGEPLSYGGDGDPLFSVVQETPLAPLHFHFSFSIAASPFGDCGLDDCFGLTPTTVLTNASDENIGFSHELFALGDTVPREFEDRPWVFTLETFYCLADNGTDCNDDNFLANGNGELRFGVIMVPEEE
jgi:hypothetical protein